jgi:hypothetical protein
MSREDVVLQRPEDVRFLVQVFHTPSACAGAATAYLLRRIAYRAGAYAPGIQEHIFHELNTSREGGSIEKVQHWFTGRVSSLHELGYRLQCRRVATPTTALLDWVRAGRGYRGAMLPTTYRKLHPTPGTAGFQAPEDNLPHAVGITIDRLDPKADEELVMIDPWPGVVGEAKDRDKVSHAVGITIDRLDPKADEELVMIVPWPGEVGEAKDRDKVSPALESAHREKNFHALVYYWVGWS